MMPNDEPIYPCRVCGYLYEDDPWGPDGHSPSFNFCVCCGTEFGYHDCSLAAIERKRVKWLAEGTPWDDPRWKPEGWTVEEQLRHVLARYWESAMTWQLHDEEFESVLALSGAERYAYFVKRVADRRGLWSLASSNLWVLASDNVGNKLVPVWPHPRFAEACASGAWTGSQPQVIELPDWLEIWTPGMLRDERRVAVFPTASDRGVVVIPAKLKADLEAELLLIE